ncbi:MAG: helix-turn-helix domain-containing protein [Campylobacterota bacterium]|nr:helix-turn-helix domain-containing protein [Campylobacterota bacterium]
MYTVLSIRKSAIGLLLPKIFRSLFGFTPKHFFRQLKLNHAYHDLKYADPLHETVSRIAFKWGFMHMGRFTDYYTALFGENPSQTLKNHNPREEFIEESCVNRQDEIK